ncbi:MAG: AAA family ATPase [Candidatus Accumulibacter sp.]|nr:AAA family ATPase [Accumulibacter sp.]
MYLEHFGLREAPFRITPHTEFFFPGAKRKATLEALIYATTHDEGIVKVSGEVGSGKTMLCRMLLETLPESVKTIYFANPSLSREEILDTIAEEFDVAIPEKRTRRLLMTIQKRLIDYYAEGRLVVIMVDEAHAMPQETLEEIRLLSNLESKRHKLLHIVLFGQPELDERLLEPAMRPLKERITHNFALIPLHRDDIGEYLMFRIRRAGYHGPDLFTPAAIRLIARVSEGLTRRINILADKALLSAFSENRHMIDARQIKAAIDDAQFNPMNHPSLSEKWLAGSLAAALIALIVSLGYFRMHEKVSPVFSTTAETTRAPARRAPLSPPSFPNEAIASPLPTRQEIAPANPVAPTASTTLTAPTMLAAPTPPVAPDPPTLDERVAATALWLESVPDSHFFLQLFSTSASNRGGVEAFLDQIKYLDSRQVRVYRSSLSGRERYGVIYGDYPSFESARADLEKLSRIHPLGQSYIRGVTKLR